jgi:hypothetical protein
VNRLQAALAVIDGFRPESDSEAVAIAQIRGLMFVYDCLYKDVPWNVLFVEKTLTAPLRNLKTGRNSRKFFLAGKLDLGFEDRGQTFICDHKTCSEEIESPDAPFWAQKVIESQPSQYHLLGWANGMKFDGFCYDVVRKPGIKPKKIAKDMRTSIFANGTYCGYKVSDEARQLMQTVDVEPLELYSYRVASECMENPARFFQRRFVPRLDSDLKEYCDELWEHSQELLHARKHERHMRNPGACINFGVPCRYLGICSGYDTPESDKWRTKQNVHSELPELDGDTRDVLTNSRIRCRQTCPRKHYYQYELGIERQDRPESAALQFGTLWHLAVNAWFAASLTEEPMNGDGTNEISSSDIPIDEACIPF